MLLELVEVADLGVSMGMLFVPNRKIIHRMILIQFATPNTLSDLLGIHVVLSFENVHYALLEHQIL